jgi:dTDP-4-dehydrorhamnose 3,5-epimerase
VITYLCDQRYNPDSEREINPLDPEIGITWPTDIDPILSDKDLKAPNFSSIRLRIN